MKMPEGLKYRLLYLIILPFLVKGQDKYMFGNKIFNIQVMYNYHIPKKDLAINFGNFNSLGTGGMFKTKDNWVLAFEGNYLYGKEVYGENLVSNLISSGGYISSTGGSPANFTVNMRGWSVYGEGGRLFGLNRRNMNSGILLKGGIGMIRHRINFYSHDGNIPQLDPDYVQGYDRLCFGMSVKEFVGYSFQSKNRLINFYIGVEFMQASTTNLRGFNYDTMQYDTGKKSEASTSFRFGWMVPIYLNTRDENEFQFK